MTEYVTPAAADAIVEMSGFHYRDRSLMLSALGAPMPVFGEEVYPGLHEKAAVLVVAVARDHALLDGNKRTAWMVVTFFYAENGFDLVDPGDAEDMMVAIGEGAVSVERVAVWLEAALNQH